MIIHDHIHQGHEEWDAWRAVRATASEFAKIFTGGGKVSGQRDAYMRKLAVARKYAMPSWAGNAYSDRGHALEPVARDLFRELSGLEVLEVACIEHDNGLCGGSPDGLIYGPDKQLLSGLEIKCLNYDKHMGICSTGKVPTEFIPQIHGGIWLAGVESWEFMVYHDEALPFDYRVIEVAKSRYTDDLAGEVLQFCDELDYNADKFIEDFERSMNGIEMKQAMPILFKQLNKQPEAQSLI